jgi:two-component system, NarL family, invasion response regulator UvrY
MNTIHVAIADDHEILRESLANAIESAGICVSIRAENGADLIAQIETNDLPHLCIIDIQMPVMDGLKATSFIKIKWPDVRIIAFSMNSDQKIISDILGIGADLYLPKSVPLDKLLTAIHELCR